MTFAIVSHQGVGDVRFGQSPEEVRAVLNSSFKSFKRTPASVHPCDHFTDLHVFVYYGDNGAEAVELAEPAKPVFQGLNLLQLSFADLTRRLLNEDPNLSVEDDGCTSIRLGIGAYAPHAAKDPMAKPESVIAFERGYYD